MYIKNRTGNGEMETSKWKNFSKIFSKAVFYVLFLCFLGVSVYMFFFSGCLEVKNISIVGNQELSSSDIQKSFDEYLQGKFLGIVSKNNLLFVSQKRAADFLENNFRKIRSVNVSKKFPDTVSINIDERKAVLVWCSGESCFLIDEEGIAYNNADFSSPEIIQNHLIRINDTSFRSVSIGEKVMESDYEKYVAGIKDAFKTINLKIGDGDDAYVTPSNVSNEIDVKTEKGAQIYFSTQFSLEDSIKTLKIVLEKEIPEDKLKDVEYIDLRSEGKVFYKFREKEIEDSENSEKQDQ